MLYYWFVKHSRKYFKVFPYRNPRVAIKPPAKYAITHHK